MRFDDYGFAGSDTANVADADTNAIARKYHDRGWAVTPVCHRGKRPLLNDWPNTRLTPEAINRHFGSVPINIGVVLGDQSNGLVDVDLDDPVAIHFADQFLPNTDCVFGRPSNPRSHRLYQVGSPGRHVGFDVAGKPILEVRGNDHLTVFPGSVHPSGESIEFEDGCDGDPGLTEWAELRTAGLKIATATLLSKGWLEGARHRLALSASGFLLNLGWGKNDVLKVIGAVCSHANDPELSDRLTCVETTYELLGQRKAVSGRHDLESILGRDAVCAIEKWSKTAGYVHTPSPAPTNGTTSDFDICTDAGAADGFADEMKEQLIYLDEQDRWFRRDNQLFRPVSYVQVQGEAKRYMQAQVGSVGILGSTRSLLSKGKIDNLLTLSRHHLRVDPELLDASKHLIGCADGAVLDLETQKFTSDRALVTKAMRCHFDSQADCPEFKKFLRQIFAENEAVISFVQRAVGYSLSGHVSEQCFFILVGGGSNGKSTLLTILQSVFGDYAATTPAQTLMVNRYGSEQTNDLAKLVGIRFVTAAETEKGQRLAESKIKRITGGDRIACRELYKNLFEYDPQFKIWLATNDPPQFAGADYSISRRIRVIEFPVTFDEASQDHGLQDRLLKESTGILNWALQGYGEWNLQGLNPPEEVMLATNSYRTENDSIGQFIEACCCVDQNGRESTGELYEKFESWCRNSGIEPMPKNSFGKELRRRGFEPIKGRSGNGWAGLRVRAE
jgi:putative DNA primase/helicase